MALPEIKTILYTSSLGKHTRPVFRHAIKMAGLYNAKIVMLHVVEPLGETAQTLIQSYLPKSMLDTIHDGGLEKVKASMQERVSLFYDEEMEKLDDQPALEIEQLVGEGNRSDVIVELADKLNADLIIMGSHNSFGTSSRTTRQVIKYAERPVMVVPTRS